MHAPSNGATGLRNPFLSNGSVNTFPWKIDAHNNIVTMETGMFSVGSNPRPYRENPRLAEAVQLIACEENSRRLM
jgi:hypothetical protein